MHDSNVIAIKNALEHIFSKTTRRPEVIQKDKGTEEISRNMDWRSVYY